MRNNLWPLRDVERGTGTEAITITQTIKLVP